MVLVPQGPKRAGPVVGRHGERALERRAFEVLRAVALDHAQRPWMLGEHAGLGQEAVHDEPLLRAEPPGATLTQLPLHVLARATHAPVRRAQRPARLPRLVRREIHDLHAGLLERAAHRRRQGREPGDHELARRFVRGPRPAVGPAPPYGRRDVGAHDRRRAVIAHDGPPLDAVQERNHGARRGREGDRVQLEGRSFHQLRPCGLERVAATRARLRHVGRPHRSGGDDRLGPTSGRRHRVRSAQPM